MTDRPSPTLQVLVFDLDDTLIDTTGLLLGPAHIDAAQAMIGAGLNGTTQEVAHARVAFTRTHPGEDLEALLIERFGASRPAAASDAGRRAFYRRPVPALTPMEGAQETLAQLRSEGRALYLLTIGDPPTQRRKVELAGLEDSFDGLCFVDIEAEDKEHALGALIDDLGLPADRILVIGDRIDREISAGRRLGCWTVRVLHGEGQHFRPSQPAQQAHYSVPDVRSIPAVVENVEQGGDLPGKVL